MPSRRRVIALALASIGAGCAAPPTAEADEGAQLRRLLERSDEAFLDRNPLHGLYRGDLRRAAQHGDYISPAYVQGERAAAESNLAQLAAIPRERLSAIDRIAYDTFRWSREDARERNTPPIAAIWPALKLEQIGGWHMFFPDLSSGQSVAPYRTVADYDNGMARIDGFLVWLERIRARLREGQRTGVVQPRVVVERLIEQFDRFAAQGRDDSPYYAPIRTLPLEITPAERERLTRAYTAALEQRLRPAFARMRTFLADEYQRSARATVGLSGVPGGAAYYEFLIRSHTTTALSAQEVHRLGLTEVERIRAAMSALMREVGFAGTLGAFFEHLRTDARFAPASAQAIADGYAEIGRRVDAALPRLFASAPKTPLVLRPTPDFQAPTAAAAHYIPGSLDSGQPGTFYFNTFDLPSRSVWSMETLYLHEATPGHHMQGALAAENSAMPKLLRFDGNTAYWEGWALYAETLGPELDLFKDPYQRFGHYNEEMLRAMRLVVDTGLHAYDWSREQAIDYMLTHSAMSRTDVEAEVERYIADPGQALAYKIGALTLQRLRRRAEQTLGPRFDIRTFHREVLETGSIPMSVLEAKIDAWIAARRGAF